MNALNNEGSNLAEARFPATMKQANDNPMHPAATKIQSAWRAKQARAEVAKKRVEKAAESDAALERAYQEATNAHAKIAATWRNFKAKKDADAAKKDKAAITIQRMVRGSQAREAVMVLRNKPIEALKKTLTERMSAVIEKNASPHSTPKDIEILKQTADSYFNALKKDADPAAVQSIKEQTYGLIKILVEQQQGYIQKLKKDIEQQIADYEAGPAVKARTTQINALKTELRGLKDQEIFDINAEGHSFAIPQKKIPIDTTQSNAALGVSQRGELRRERAQMEVDGARNAADRAAKSAALQQQEILWNSYSKALAEVVQAAETSINDSFRVKLATARDAANSYFSHINPTTEQRNTASKPSWNDRTSVQQEEKFIFEQLDALEQRSTNKAYTTNKARLNEITNQLDQLNAIETTMND